MPREIKHSKACSSPEGQDGGCTSESTALTLRITDCGRCFKDKSWVWGVAGREVGGGHLLEKSRNKTGFGGRMASWIRLTYCGGTVKWNCPLAMLESEGQHMCSMFSSSL